jgi:hypothetical protein
MLFLIVLIIAVVLVAIYHKTPVTIKSHPWNHFYDNIQFSPSDFYQHVKEGLESRKISGLSYGKESFLQSHIFSAKREYMRITQSEYVFYVCAAPFGTGTFVSWWLCVKNEKTINKMPILSKLAGKDRNNKSFYQMDTEAMYQQAVHSTVISVADALTAEKGYRLSDSDRQFLQAAK